MLAMDLLEMSQDIPTDSKHAALNAISRLLSVPQKGVDVYEMLVNVHANFAFGDQPDRDLKAMIAGIYGSLGTIERNVIFYVEDMFVNTELSSPPSVETRRRLSIARPHFTAVGRNYLLR